MATTSDQSLPPHDGQVPPGLSRHSLRLLNYLPEAYRANDGASEDPAAFDAPANFFSRFLAIFESVLLPIEWNVTNFDLFLDPRTAPQTLLPWLAGWLAFSFHPSWTTERRRLLLQELNWIYRRRGTKMGLRRLLQIYLGFQPDASPNVIIRDEDLKPCFFQVEIPIAEKSVSREAIEELIGAFKPAHTRCELIFADPTE